MPNLVKLIVKKILPIFPALDGLIYNLKLDKFSQSAHQIIQFIQQSSLDKYLQNISQDNPPVGILILPWYSTAVPWYSIVLGIGLIRQEKRVVFIWDDTEFPVLTDSRFNLRIQNYAIKHVLNHLPQEIKVLRLSQENLSKPSAETNLLCDLLLDLNITWSLKAGQDNKELVEEAKKLKKLQIDNLQTTILKVTTLLGRISFEYLILPNGINNSTGVFLDIAEKQNIRVATYDSGFNTVLLSSNGIAAQLSDTPLAIQKIYQANDAVQQWAINEAKKEMGLRLQGKDADKFQAEPFGKIKNNLKADVVIFLNLEWDAAALGRHHIFKNTIEWVISTIRFVLDTSDKFIVIRQHPVERYDYAKSNHPIEIALNQNFLNNEKIRFIRANEQVNSYDLIESASVVLPYVSTIGIEAAALGKSVIVAGKAYDSNLGFVWAPKYREMYFEMLKSGIKGELNILPEQCEKAWLCYYLAQKCNFLRTDFTPSTEDFLNWSQEKPENIFKRTEVKNILKSIDKNIPLSWLIHIENYEKQGYS